MIFEQVGTHKLPDEKLIATEYRHPLGLRHIHIPSAFPEIGYALVFPTATKNDTGIPHILEHLTMCGSDKYRQKDPFFSMLDRTVAHELNAHTARTATTYHFATTDAVDYINMAQVYTDLAFNPLLRRRDFNREGWRMEQDADGKPKLNGVVLNEMLGVFGNPAAHIREAIYRSIDPKSPEARISGGHPLSIPALSYEDLRTFHDEHYNPQAAVIVTTGEGVPIGALHAVLDEALIRRADRKEKEAERPPAEAFITTGANAIGYWDEKEVDDIHGRKALVVQIPGQQHEPAQTHWIWRTDWKSSPIEELYDQLMTEVLFNPHNSPAIEKLQNEIGGEVDISFLPDLSRQGGHIALVVTANGVDQKQAAMLGNRIEQALEESVKEGVRMGAWNQNLARVQLETLLPRPIHAHVDQMVEAMFAGLPFGQDHDNREATAHLRLAGVPDGDSCLDWWQRWERAPIITTVSDPELLNRWRAQLIDMAQNKWNAGMRVAEPDIDTKVDDNKNLPIVNADYLNPVPAAVAGLWLSPARGADGWEAHLPNEDENTQLDAGAWLRSSFAGAADTTYTGSGFRHACHRHVRCADNDPIRQATLEFDITDLPADTLNILRTYALLSSHLGRGEESHHQTRASEAESLVNSTIKMDWQMVGGIAPENLRLTMMIKVESSRADGLGGPTTTSWLAKIMTDTVDQDEAAWSNVCRRLISSIRQEEEDLLRAEKEKAAEAFVDVKKQRIVDEQRIERTLLTLMLAEGAPDKLRDQVQDAWIQMRQQCPVRVGTVGDRPTLAGGEILARMVAGTAAEFGTHQAWQRPMERTGACIHIPKPDAGNVCKRIFGVPSLSTDKRLETTLRVAGSLIDPLFHEHIREKGGAYGARMATQDETIVFHSYRDPGTDTTYETYGLARDFLIQSCAEADPENLARAKLQVAQRLLNPGDESRYRKIAIIRHNQGYGRDRDAELLEILKSITWADVAAAANFIDPAQTPFVDISIGPDRPKRFDKAPITEDLPQEKSARKPK